MGQRNTDTAVLIFSLSARREAERKALFGRDQKHGASELFEILIRRTKKIAAASGVDAFFIDESKQRGLNFGERYANAFQQIFDKGYTKVVSIGNDTPDLTADSLRRAIDEIQHKDLVTGPSTDGGLYLFGLDRSLFNTDEFLKLPWLKDSLCDVLSESTFWQQGGSFSLDVLLDIDDTSSLLRFVKTTSDSFLADFILLHISRSRNGFDYYKDILISDAQISSLTLRGPPSYNTYSKNVQKAA